RGGGLASDDRETKHGNRIRDHIEHRSRYRQRERPIQRILFVTPQFLVAARAPRGRAGRKLRKPLQQVTMWTSDEVKVDDRLIVFWAIQHLFVPYLGNAKLSGISQTQI